MILRYSKPERCVVINKPKIDLGAELELIPGLIQAGAERLSKFMEPKRSLTEVDASDLCMMDADKCIASKVVSLVYGRYVSYPDARHALGIYRAEGHKYAFVPPPHILSDYHCSDMYYATLTVEWTRYLQNLAKTAEGRANSGVDAPPAAPSLGASLVKVHGLSSGKDYTRHGALPNDE